MSTTDIQTPAQKRKRAEDSIDESPPAEPVRSAIWYADGNVILEAEGVQFKVHKSILAQNSSIFEDMFSLPQPPSSSCTDTVDGCPIVHLSDSAEEMGYILNALFKNEYLSYGEKLEFPVLSAFLCLGRKYDIRKLELEGRKRIYNEFSTTLQEYDAVGRGIWKTSFACPRLSKSYHLLEFLALARRMDLLSILPQLFYFCCSKLHPAADLVKGWRDGTYAACSADDQLTILAGFEAIYRAQAKTTFAWLYQRETLAQECATSYQCELGRAKYLRDMFTPVPFPVGLLTWEYADVNLFRSLLCEHCTARARALHEAGRLEFWKLLPSLFGLPPWEELLKEREEIA
ncbi:hypothetical protein HWV62_28122 [Athelia sp. TMB]|nr:hypothetical protein HWV62_28122 [Athelia sp. TMB]